MASFFSKLFGGGRKGGFSQQKTTSALQDRLLELLEGGLGGQGALGGALGGFDPEEIAGFFQQGVADPARKQFQEQVLPGLEQRAIGSGLTRASGGLRQELEASSGLESMLASQLAQQQMGARESALSRQLQAMGIGLGTPQVQTVYDPGQRSGIQDIFAGLAGAGGRALGGYASGGISNLLKGFSR